MQVVSPLPRDSGRRSSPSSPCPRSRPWAQRPTDSGALAAMLTSTNPRPSCSRLGARSADFRFARRKQACEEPQPALSRFVQVRRLAGDARRTCFPRQAGSLDESVSSRRCRRARGAGGAPARIRSGSLRALLGHRTQEPHEIKPPSGPPRSPGSRGAESRVVFQSGRVRCCG